MIGLLLLLFLALSFVELRLTQLSKILPFVNSVFFFGLVNLNLLILLTLCWLIFRNIGKLFLERRQNTLGASLKTKLVLAFLGFSLVPTGVLFTISALYINSSFDKWFSVKVQNTLQASLEITRSYYRTVSDAGVHFASKIAQEVIKNSKRGLPSDLQIEKLQKILANQRSLLLLDAVEYYSIGGATRILVQKKIYPSEKEKKSQSLITYYVPWVSQSILNQAVQGENFSVVEHIGSGDLIRCLFPVKIDQGYEGVVVVNVYIPISLRTKVDAIISIFDDYHDTNSLKIPMKKMYLIILIMVTLVILFVVVWVGLYLARQLTEPVARLVEGVGMVGAGNLDVQVDTLLIGSGKDEIGVLVRSFNKMTMDLKEKQTSLLKLTDAFEKRSTELETILTSIGTGVLVLDRFNKIVICNPLAANLLGLEAKNLVGNFVDDIFVDALLPLRDLIQRIFISQQLKDETIGIWSTQFRYSQGPVDRLLNATVKELKQVDRWLGLVIAVDDMTHIAKSQREVAWQEVARRIAHEIKNPLTPIQLSAQRMQRRFFETEGVDAELVRKCTGVIINQTDQLKEMVNEFSNFARFPQISICQQDLNTIIEEVVMLFEQAHLDIYWVRKFDKGLPSIGLDEGQIKRVLMNLFDNSVSALNHLQEAKEGKSIWIQTRYLEALRIAQIEVTDNGPGMEEAVKAAAFEPYFSTKSSGTGLGLAIVKRIINDHNGVIRLRSEKNSGTVVIIELPVLAESGIAAYVGNIRGSLSTKETFIET